MGGVGKSSLAAEVVHTLAAEPGAFPGGVTWVRCDERAGLEGLTWIADQLLAAWGTPLSAEAAARAATPEAGLELRERALRERLRPAGASAQPAPALALLDNVERDLPLARLLDTVAPLGITTLLTSRSEPASPRVRLLRLEVLAPEPAIQLFAERFVARGGSWSAAGDEPSTRAIVDALGGLPLAIELAAARAARTSLPLPTLAEELHAPDVLARLTDPLDPSASVRYSLSKTLAALTGTQRARFAALGLPTGPDWPEGVVERMFAGLPLGRVDSGSAHADLDALSAYSLVSFVIAAEQSTSRIRLHPLVRELAREELAHQGEGMRHATLAGLLAGVSAWVAQGHGDEKEILAQVLADEDLIVGTLRAAYAAGVDLPLALTITSALEKAQLYLFRPLISEELETLKLGAARTLGDRREELSALDWLSRTVEATGHGDAAARYRQEALPIARALGERATVVEYTAALGATAAAAGRLDEAQRLYDEARATMRGMDEHPMDGRMLNILGILATKLGHLDEAASLLERASTRAHETGDLQIEALALVNLGEVLESQGEYGEARRLYEQSLTLWHDGTVALVGELDAESAGPGAAWYDKIGEIALKTGEFEAAASYFQEALALYAQEPTPPYNHMTRNYVTFVQERVALVSPDQATRDPALADAREAKRRRRWPWSRG